MDDNWQDNEPEYIPVGDEFEDKSWKFGDTAFHKRCLSICGRKYFHKEVEKKRLTAIESRMGDDSTLYPEEYVDRILQWAQQKNLNRTAIMLPDLITAIRNRDNLAKYLKKKHQKGELNIEPTSSQYAEGEHDIPE